MWHAEPLYHWLRVEYHTWFQIFNAIENNSYPCSVYVVGVIGKQHTEEIEKGTFYMLTPHIALF